VSRGNYGIMLTRKVTDVHGVLQTEVQVMDFAQGGIWRFTLDALESDELPDDLKEYIRANLEKIRNGRWNYTGQYRK
jgi:hypothetical protein